MDRQVLSGFEHACVVLSKQSIAKLINYFKGLKLIAENKSEGCELVNASKLSQRESHILTKFLFLTTQLTMNHSAIIELLEHEYNEK